MTARLFQFIGSPYCAKVRKILDFKGIDFEAVEVDYLERKELLAATNQLTVPALTLENGETIVDSARIASRLEELFPEPTILPSRWRGMHRVLAGYIDTELAEVLFRWNIPDKAAHWRERGRDREALWRFTRERKYGAGFIDRMIEERPANLALAVEALTPFEEAIGDNSFLFGRIGLADFALYGQLYYFAFTGELKIPTEFTNLRAYFSRINRISSRVEPE